MADDILAQFEQPGGRLQQARPEPGEQAASTGEKPEYVAFETQDKLITVELERAAAPWRAPLLKYYLDISYSPRFWSGFTMFFTFMRVSVTGRNLKPVIDAVRFGKCTCLREYHPDLFTAPGEAEPLIERIEILTRPSYEDEPEQGEG